MRSKRITPRLLSIPPAAPMAPAGRGPIACRDYGVGRAVCTMRSSYQMVWLTGDPSPMYGAMMN